MMWLGSRHDGLLRFAVLQIAFIWKRRPAS
jgi:hypothetical protein